MAELRMRKGAKRTDEGDDKLSREKMAVVEEFLSQVKPKPKPGTSNEAKEIKDKLKEDPFNMELIFKLGKAYAADYQWERCATILLRGFKRASEFKDRKERFDFLMTLCQASIQLKKYKQALAVVNDVETPGDQDDQYVHEIMKCRVYCFNGDTEKGLKAFNRAIDGLQFEGVTQTWASCSDALRMADCWIATKTTVTNMAKNDEDRQKLDSIEKMIKLKEDYLAADEKPKMSGTEQTVFYTVIFIAVVMFFYFLWCLEARSLEKLQLKK